jgi:hypothetical protein
MSTPDDDSTLSDTIIDKLAIVVKYRKWLLPLDPNS